MDDTINVGTPMVHEVFRFAHIAKPDLFVESGDNAGFIQPPSEIGNKIAKSVKKDKSSVSLFSSLKEVNNAAPDLFAFANKIRKSKNFLTEEFATTVEVITELDEDQGFVFWENLAYQIISRDSAVVMEAVIRVIQANNFVVRYKAAIDKEDLKSQTHWNKVAAATIVVPREVLPEKPELPEHRKNIPDEQSRKIIFNKLEAEIARHRMSVLRRMIKELKCAKKAYQDLYQSEYNTAYTQYLTDNPPAIDESTAATSPPPFEFTPPDPFNKVFLQKLVSDDTYSHIFNILTNCDKTLQDICRKIEKEAGEEAVNIIKYSPTTKQPVFYKGIRIPQRDRPLSNTFAIKAVPVIGKKGYYSIYATQYFNKSATRLSEVTVSIDPGNGAKEETETSCNIITQEHKNTIM